MLTPLIHLQLPHTIPAGTLELLSDSVAVWRWHRNTDDGPVAGESWRGAQRCRLLVCRRSGLPASARHPHSSPRPPAAAAADEATIIRGFDRCATTSR